MRTRTHTKAAGTDAGADFMSQISRKQDEGQFYDSTTVKVEQTTRGVRFHARIPPPAKGGTAGDQHFQGVYTPGAYNFLDEVVIQAGPGEGEYVCLADGNTNDPRTGIDWIQVSSLNQWF